MALEISIPQSPGWWMSRLNSQLKVRNKTFDLLMRYYEGDPPLPEGAENARAAYQAVARKARTNFAELIVDVVLDRMRIRAIRTAVESDQDGDKEAWKIHQTNGMRLLSMEIFKDMLTLGVGYAMVGLPPEGSSVPVFSAEDPRQFITEHDPLQPRLIRAGFKIIHDDALELDVAYLYLAGKDDAPVKVYRASKKRKASKPGLAVPFTPATWDWDAEAGGEDGQEWTATKRVPAVRFLNRNGTGEFAAHLDLLDRINHQILQRMVIAMMQAFRQRAIKGLPDVYPADHPKAGQEINYEEIFAADPGALWQLPDVAEMWESAQTDLRPILDAVKDDVLHLAAVTRTPLPTFTPDAVTQTAEGASAAREGLVFKVEDRDARAEDGLADQYSLAFEILGDAERSQVHAISIDWAPAERFSLAERASAAVQAKTAGVPWETRQSYIWQFTPEEIARQKSERADDQLLELAVAAQTAAATESGLGGADGG